MNLGNDITRCAGRFGLMPDDPICPRRGECQRYRQMDADRQRWPEGYPLTVPVHTGLCRDGGDYLIPVTGGAA